jgi:hypothetical protein
MLLTLIGGPLRAVVFGLSPVTRKVAGSIPAKVSNHFVAQRIEHLKHP